MQSDHGSDLEPKDIPPSNEAISEIQEYTVLSRQRRRLLPRAALVGLFSGLVASLFRLALSGVDALRASLLTWAHQAPSLGWLAILAFSAAGALISALLVSRLAPETSGSGIPHLKAVLYRFREMDWRRVLPVKFLAGIAALGSGLALGREGPTVQMGGAVGDALSAWFKAAPRERRTLIAAGAGAGLAAAFNAPLSGLTFVLEEVQRDFQPIVFAAAFIAALVADIVARLLAGPNPVFSIPNYPTPPLVTLPLFVLLGIAAGLLGILFNSGLLASLNITARLRGRSKLGWALIVGALTGLVAWVTPFAVGGGHTLAEAAMNGQLLLGMLPVWFVLRFIMTTTSYGTGMAGGIFTPLLVLGALLGLGFGQLAKLAFPGMDAQPAVFAVVGMAAYFTAIVRAPLTGILLIVEMTGSFQQMLPLLVACFCAYAVAELLHSLPVYEALLERDLALSGSVLSVREPVVVDFTVESGAPFDGLLVRNLGLPPGCVLVRCALNGREFVPTAATRLEAYMKITAVVAPEAAASIDALQRGCKAREDLP